MLKSSMEEKPECGICAKPVNDEKDDYEIIETFLEGNHEDVVYLHTDCRYKEEQKTKVYLESRIVELKTRVDNWTNHSQAGQTAYSITVARLETYEEIFKSLDDKIVQESRS